MMNEEFYAFWLSFCTRIPLGKLWKSVNQLGSMEALYYAKEKELSLFTEKEYAYIRQMKECQGIRKLWEEQSKQDYQFLSYKNVLYPSKLLELKEPPFGIYYQGKEEINPNSPVVGMVGARNCTIYGSEMAYRIARELGRQGIVVVSGLAAGIDGASHRGCLDGGGYTLGILGTGIETIYPKENYNLYLEMRKRGGILTEYPPETKPLPMLFPRRNRLISILADFILVVEAREKSGSLITVDFALEQGRDVGVVPGRPCDALSMGCNRLLQQGAKCILTPEDVMEAVLDSGRFVNCKTEKPKVNTDLGLAPKEKMVYSCLRLEPQFIDDILCQLKLSVWEGIQILTELEIKGIIKQNPHHYYYRVQ